MLHKSSNFTFKPLNPFAMKSSILLLAVAALVFSSCTSAYKTGQTPDDVYYSPVRPGGSDEYVQTEEKEDRQYRGSDEYYEDRYLRMRVQNRSRWSPLDDYYLNSPYAYNYSFYGNNSNWSNPYNNYWCWNNYYNPYYSGSVIIKNPKAYTPPPSRPVAFNSNSYGTPQSGSMRSPGNRISNSYNTNNNNNSPRYNNRNSNSVGNTLRKVFSNSNDSYQPDKSSSSGSSSTPSRSYNPSSSSSSSSSGRSSSSSGSSSGATTRPAR
jgi:uncharacterized membrane protein YgcG